MGLKIDGPIVADEVVGEFFAVLSATERVP